MKQFNAKKVMKTKGVSAIIAANKNPRNKKMFDAIINGDIDESVAPSDYVKFDVTFEGDDLENTLRVMTRRKINAFGNDVSKSADCFFNNIIAEMNARNNISDKFHAMYVSLLNKQDDPYDKKTMASTLAAIVRCALISVLNENSASVTEAANTSESTDNVEVEVVEHPLVVTPKEETDNNIRFNESDKAIVIDEIAKNLKCDRATAEFILYLFSKTNKTGQDLKTLLTVLPDEYYDMIANGNINNILGVIINKDDVETVPDTTPVLMLNPTTEEEKKLATRKITTTKSSSMTERFVATMAPPPAVQAFFDKFITNACC